MEAIVEKPTKKDQQVAKRSISLIDKIGIGTTKKTVAIDINDEETTHIEIPVTAFRFLKFILSNMAEGKAISLVPEETELSTQQAADMLNVSRPHIVKLLDKGEIPFKRVGTHRRIKLEDLERYDQQKKEKREKALAQLAKEAQELKLGY